MKCAYPQPAYKFCLLRTCVFHPDNTAGHLDFTSRAWQSIHALTKLYLHTGWSYSLKIQVEQTGKHIIQKLK